jgi:hypothetical protein
VTKSTNRIESLAQNVSPRYTTSVLGTVTVLGTDLRHLSGLRCVHTLHFTFVHVLCSYATANSIATNTQANCGCLQREREGAEREREREQRERERDHDFPQAAHCLREREREVREPRRRDHDFPDSCQAAHCQRLVAHRWSSRSASCRALSPASSVPGPASRLPCSSWCAQRRGSPGRDPIAEDKARFAYECECGDEPWYVPQLLIAFVFRRTLSATPCEFFLCRPINLGFASHEGLRF